MLDMLRVALVLPGAVLVFGAVAPYLATNFWWTRIWIIARQQMAILSVALLVIYVVFIGVGTFWDALFVTMLAAVSLLCAVEIAPFLSFAPSGARSNDVHEKSGEPFKVLMINVLQSNEETGLVLNRIKESNADIVFLSETNQRWAEAMANIKEEYSHHYELPLEECNGLLFYSRFPVDNVAERYLSQDHIPSLTIDVDFPNGRRTRIYAIHPRPPRPEDGVENLDHELRIIADEISRLNGPAIVIGDFNEVCWSPAIKSFRKSCGLLDPRKGRGLFNSYGATSWYEFWPIDHLFHTKEFKVQKIRRLGACGSDHYPMEFSLTL